MTRSHATVVGAPFTTTGAIQPPDSAGVTALAPTAEVFRTDRVGCLEAVATALACPLALDHIGEVVAGAAVEALGAQTALVGLRHADGHLRVVHECGLPSSVRNRLPGGLAARSPQAVAQALAGIGYGDALAAPMPAPHGPVGMLAVGRLRAGSFAYGDQTFLNALAAVAALGFERFRLENDHRRRRQHDLRFSGSNAEVGDLRIDLEDQEVIFEGRRARLTPSELRILLFLAAQPGHARTRREILRHLWHSEFTGDERACDAHISNLRRKIERDPSRPNRVVTVRGVGYALYLPRNGA